MKLLTPFRNVYVHVRPFQTKWLKTKFSFDFNWKLVQSTKTKAN